jgi:hypothetical protein
VGILPVWGENNRNDLARGRAKTQVIRPVLIDREIPRLQAQLDALNKLADENKTNPAAPALTADQKKEFIDLTTQLKLLTDRRALLLSRTGDEYVIDPPRLAAKP